MLFKTSSSHRWSPGQIYLVLLQRNWRVEMMGSGITTLCDCDVTGSCRTGEIEGVGTVELVCVGGLLRMGGESLLLPVWISVRGGFIGRGVGCLSSQGSYLTARKLPWDGNRIDWDGGCFYQECLPSPPGGWIRLNFGAWWGRENCLVY